MMMTDMDFDEKLADDIMKMPESKIMNIHTNST